MFRFSSLLLVQQFVSVVLATRFAMVAEETPYIPGYFAKEASIPRPTSPPQAVRALVPRDVATCGYMKADGNPNTCGTSQYCTTTATGTLGVWNCCNPDSCYLEDSCTYDDECTGDSPYCVTSYMSDSGTTYSRFMCGTTSSLVFMVYSSEDLPQYSSSVAAVSQSAAAASSKAAAQASSLSAEVASLSAAKVTTPVTLTMTNSAGQTETQIVQPASKTGAAPSASTSSSGGGGGGGGGGVSGGTIAGAVVGAIGGLALLGAGAFILWRVMKKRKEDTDDVPQMTGVPVAEKQWQQHPAEGHYAPGSTAEGHYAPAHYAPSEAPTQSPQTYHEMGDSNYR